MSFWLLTPILYYSNVWYTAYLPILSRQTFDNMGTPYDVSRILTPQNTFNQTAYEEYSPMLLPVTFAMSYGLGFAACTAVVVHTFLYYGRQIWSQTGRSLREQPDIHARLMRAYPSVPDWWYLVLFGEFARGLASTRR